MSHSMEGQACSGFRHHVLVYESDDNYADRGVAFLREGLAAGEATMVSSTRSRIAVLREAMGADAERVTFTDVAGMYLRPARTIAAYYAALTEQLQRAPAVRALAEVLWGPTEREQDEWIAYEAITNRAYAHLPAWVVCTYDASSLPDRVIEAAERVHSDVLTDQWRPSERFEDPQALVRKTHPPRGPLEGLRSVDPGEDPQALRERLAAELSAEHVAPAKALDMLVAATEVAQNACLHGGGLAGLGVGRVHGRFVCEITDRRGGSFDDPLAGYLAPREDGAAGQGLWVARQLTWRLELEPAAGSGLTVRLWL